MHLKLILLTALAAPAYAQTYALYECVENAPRLAGTPLAGYPTDLPPGTKHDSAL